MPAATKGKKGKVPFPHYADNLKAPIHEFVNDSPKAPVRRVEWSKLMAGDPLQIHPTKCHGYKIMSVEEWSSLWKKSDRFAKCLGCGSDNTKEHFFIQSFCSGRKRWDQESLCLDCLKFSYRSYVDPEWALPEENLKAHWMDVYRRDKAREIQAAQDAE